LSALRATTEALDVELTSLIPDHRKRYKYDYIGDIYSQTDLMARVMGNAEIYGRKFGDLMLTTEPTLLMGEVIGPAVTQTRFLLQNRRLKPHQIWYSDVGEIPSLHIDKGLLQQVFFNLLANAIKYAFKDPDQFKVEIAAELKDGWYRIYFRDWGSGLEHAQRAADREPTLLHDSNPGLGLGLSMAGRIIREHGGLIKLTNHSQPTEFTIMLPESLRNQPPRQG